MLRRALTHSPQGPAAAAKVCARDAAIDAEFQSILSTHHVHDGGRATSPRAAGDLGAKSFERIGDHARNIAEHVIYVVKAATCATSRSPSWSARRSPKSASIQWWRTSPPSRTRRRKPRRHGTRCAAPRAPRGDRAVARRYLRDPSRLDAARLPRGRRSRASCARRALPRGAIIMRTRARVTTTRWRSLETAPTLHQPSPLAAGAGARIQRSCGAARRSSRARRGDRGARAQPGHAPGHGQRHGAAHGTDEFQLLHFFMTHTDRVYGPRRSSTKSTVSTSLHRGPHGGRAHPSAARRARPQRPRHARGDCARRGTHALARA